MALRDELEQSVVDIFQRKWETVDGRVVPDPDDVGFANEGVEINGTVLYADLAESTVLVDTSGPQFAAEIYKSYLHCAAKIIASEEGVITAYDGDRIMAVYVGKFKNQSAARSALKINYAVRRIINPALKTQYQTAYEIKQVVGVDTSPLLVAQTGIRGSKDLVWVGRAANHAAKLCNLPPAFGSRITKEVYDALPDAVRLSDGASMWQQMTWNAMHNRTIYRSNWIWPI
jgi:class 3 adenylate cyclase